MKRFLFSQAFLTLLFFFVLEGNSTAQKSFQMMVDHPATDVENQEKTGTCWSFSTASLIESEILRKQEKSPSLSEMYIVRSIYKEKALNYVLRQGKAQFSQGSLAHDYLNAAKKYGLVPESVYPGKKVEGKYNHNQLVEELKNCLDTAIERKASFEKWSPKFEEILNRHLGEDISSFHWNGRTFTPLEFYDFLPFSSDDYLHFTSFSHHPFGESFILEIPDNFSNGSFTNLPLNHLQEVVDAALKDGYTVLWDGDVSEKGFDANRGIAILDSSQKVTQNARQDQFFSFATTDDHLMHITGVGKDENGDQFYKVKNSWGQRGPYNGYLFMSEDYFLLKTVAITVHRNAVSKKIRKSLP